MNEPFVPLNQTAAPGQHRADAHVTIVNAAGNLRPFQPLGRAGGKTGPASPCEPRVTLQREGGRISAIHLQCSCGQTIELACVYDQAEG